MDQNSEVHVGSEKTNGDIDRFESVSDSGHCFNLGTSHLRSQIFVRK